MGPHPGKDMRLSVSVVIPTWNAAAFVARMLPALVAQRGAEFEILVVDNGVVNGETEAVVAQHAAHFPALRYLKFEKQLGYAGAVNAGAAAARFDLVAVLNNDNIPSPGWLEELVKKFAAAATPQSSVIVSSLVDRPGFPDPLACNLNFWARIVRLRDWRSDGRLFHPDGSAFLFDRLVFPVPYDEDYFVYQEDVALGWRAWLEGHRVLMAPDSRAVSFDGGSTRRIAFKTAYFTERNRWLNYLYFMEGGLFLRALPLLWADLPLRFLSGGRRWAKFRAWVSVLGNLGAICRRRAEIQRARRRPDH